VIVPENRFSGTDTFIRDVPLRQIDRGRQIFFSLPDIDRNRVTRPPTTRYRGRKYYDFDVLLGTDVTRALNIIYRDCGSSLYKCRVYRKL